MAYSYKANRQTSDNGQTGNTTRSSGYSYRAAHAVGANQIQEETLARNRQIAAARQSGNLLQDYYNVLSRATDYASSAPASGRSVTDYQPIQNQLGQYANNDNLLNMIRTAYGANSGAEQALNSLRGYQRELGGVMANQMSYYAGQTPSFNSYEGKTLSEMEDEIKKLQDARAEAERNGRSTAAADRLIRNAQNYVQNNLGGYTQGMSSEEMRNLADSYTGGSFMDQLRSFGTAEANRAGNVGAEINRLAGEREREEVRAERAEARDSRINEILGPMSGRTLADYEAREAQIQDYIQSHPFAYSADAPADADYDQNYADYEYLSQEYQRIHGETERLRRSESLNSLLGEMPDTSAASLRARLEAANALAEGYVMQTNDITAEQYENLQEEGKMLADEIWYADIEEAKTNMPSNLLRRLENGEDVTKELQDLGYSEDQIENLLYYGRMQRDARIARDRERRLSDAYTSSFGAGLAGTVGTRTAASLTSGLGFADSTFQLVVHPERPINYNTALNRWANTDEIISEAIMNEVNWTDRYGNDAFDKLYQFTTSTLDSVVTGLLTTGYGTMFAEAGLSTATADLLAQGIGDAVFFGSAAQSYMRDAVANGASDSQAIMGGLLAGTAEALFEHVSLEHFYDSAMHRGSLRALAKDYLISAGINGSEEFFTETANILTDWLIMGDISDVATKYNELLEAGYTPDEARRMTIFNMAGRALEAGISGMLQGAVMSAVSTASSAIGTSQLGSRISDEGVALLRERTGRELESNYDRGVAFTEVFEQTRDAMVSDRSIENYLRTSGVTTGDMSQMVKIVRKTLAGASLTPEEFQVMRRSPEAARAFSALVQEEGVQNDVEFTDEDTAALNRRANQLVAQNDANKRLVALAASTGDPVAMFTAAQEAYGDIESEPEYTSDTGFREAVARGTLSDNARQTRANLYAAETARVETENVARRERNEAEVTPISEETFSNQFSAAYNTGRAYYDRTAEQRANVVRDYGEWAGTAFDLGAAEVRDLDLRGSARARTTGTVTDITQAELQKLFKNGGAIVPSSRNSAELAKMPKGERDAYNRRKAERRAVEYVAKAVGAKVVLYESTNEKTANGWYDHATGTIYLDVKAGDFGNRSMLRAMAHELTHLIQTRSPSEYAALRSFILDKYFDGKQERLDQRVAEAMENDPSLKPEYALDEVIADSCEMMLRDTEAIKQIYNENRGLFNRIKDFIDKVVKALKDAFNGVDTYSEAANDMREYWGEIQRLWDAGLVAASIQNVDSLTEMGISEDVAVELDNNNLTVEAGAVVSRDLAAEASKVVPPVDPADVQNSPRTTPLWKQEFMKRVHYYTTTDAKRAEYDALFTAIDRFNEAASLEQTLLADSDSNAYYMHDKMGPLRTNQEYRWTFDIALSCPRTFQFLAYRDIISERLGRPLTLTEATNLVDIMKMMGQQIPCTYCYSENKRMLLAGSYCNFMAYRQASIDAYRRAISEGKSQSEAIDEAAKYGYGWKTDGTQNNAGRQMVEKWVSESTFNPSAEKLTSLVSAFKNSVFSYLDGLLESREIRNGDLSQKTRKRKGEVVTEWVDTTGTSVNALVKKVGERFGLLRNGKDVAKGVSAELALWCADWKYHISDNAEMRVSNGTQYEQTEEFGLTNGYELVPTIISVEHDGWAYAKSASSAKLVQNYSPYSHQLQNISETDKQYINGMGGLRKHSTNDFRLDYVQDYFLLFADMAEGRWLGHTYTKSEEYVKIFGRTGDKINMSIAITTKRGPGGKPIFVENEQEGFNWTRARELREAYPNAGIMCMVTDDEQFKWAMEQDWIDMIIPFHSSGMTDELMKRRGWQNYQGVQNESFFTNADMTPAVTAAGYEVPKFTDEDGKLKVDSNALKELYAMVTGKTLIRAYSTEDSYGFVKPHFYPYDSIVNVAMPNPETGRFEYEKRNGEVRIKKFPVTIPGHHNNVQEYFRLCDRYAVHPRFYGMDLRVTVNGEEHEITDHGLDFTPVYPAYLKLIKETSRTGTNALDTNFSQEPVRVDVLSQRDDYLSKNYGKQIHGEANASVTPMEYALYQLRQEAMSESGGNYDLPYWENYDSGETGPGIIDAFLSHFAGVNKLVDPGDYLPFRKIVEAHKAADRDLAINGIDNEDGWISQAEYERLAGEYAKQAEGIGIQYADYDEQGIRNGSALQRAQSDNDMIQRSVRKTEDGLTYVLVEPNSQFNDPTLTLSELRTRVRKYLLARYKGLTLPIGKTGSVLMTAAGLREYGNPRFSPDEDVYRAKQVAASELADLLRSAKYHHWGRDRGTHQDAKRGWNYYNVLFAVPVDGTYRVFTGVVNVKRTAEHDAFKDITIIEDVSDGNRGGSVLRSIRTIFPLQTSSGSIIPQSDQIVNPNDQRSSRRSRLSSIDMVEAIDNYDGIDESVAQSLRDVKELYYKYRDNQREVARINEELRGDTQNKGSLEKRKASLLKTRDNLSYQIDAIMEQKGVRDFLEAERTELVSLFEESAGAGRDYVNRYYNAPMREAIEAERRRTSAAREQTRLVREAGQERLDAAEQEWRERFARLRRRYSDSKLRALERQAEEMRMSFRERMERQQERMASNALRETARNRLARLVNMLETNNDKTHVISELRGPVARFIEALNPIPQNTRSEKARQAAENWRDALAGIQNLADGNSPVASLIIEQNRDAFDALSRQIGDLESLIRDNSRLTEMGENVQRAIIDTTSRGSTASVVARGTLAADTLSEETSVIDYMNSEQLTQLNRVLRAVQAIVNSANRVFANAKYESRQQMVEDSHAELDKIEGDPAVVKVGNGKVEQTSLQTQRFLAWRNGTPYYVFKRFGDVGKNLYMSLAKGWGQMSQDVYSISEAVKAAGISERETQRWREDIIEAKIPTLLGQTKTAHFTMAQLMSLYCHFRQEQSLLHINGGGFTFAGSDVTRTDYNTYHMSLEEAQALFDQYLPVGSAARNAADFLQHYMQTVGARMGNVVTRALYGYEYFNPDEYYFPVRASDDQMVDKTSDPTQSLFALLHMTETRARNPKANSKLVVGDIFDIFNSHMADMAKYKNLALPVLDIVNWLNGRASGGTIKEDLRKAFGAIQNGDRTSSIAGDYVSKFIKDINATYSGGGLLDQEAGKFLSRMKKAAVAASLRVALQQPFSYTRAMYTMNPKYLTRALGIHGDLKQNIDEAMRYSGLARAKSQGAFSSDLSPTLREQIIGSNDWRDKISQKAIILAEKMDEVTWGAIWRASKYQVDNEGYEGKFYKKGSAEYFEAVRAVFDEVILSTQVMDGTLTRSEFMRDKSLYSKIMTAFMAEPTLTYNMMLDGLETVRLAKRSGGDVRQARGKLARAMGTWAATQIANALITALVDSFRDDDDYERFFDKFADHFGTNLLGNMNPLDGIPLIKTMWDLIISTWKGTKSPLGTEFQGITQSVKALRALYDTIRNEKTEANSYGKMSTWGLIYSGLQAVSYLSGLPIANFSRTVTGAYNVMAQVWNDVFAPLNGNYLKHITTYSSETNGYDELFQAEVNGNARRQENLLAEFAVHGVTGDDIGKEMRSRTRDAFIEGSIGAQKARSILMEYGYDNVDEEINFWTFKRDYPGVEKPTSSMANAYYDTFQSMGISATEFAQYWRYIHGDGITQDEVRTYISSLQIPGNVKAALWGTKYSSEW